MVDKRDFTDRFLKSVKPAPVGKRVIVYDAQVPGFGLRITDKSNEADRGAFVLVARFPGKSNPAPRRIGDYPSMSLAKAREIAREWRTDIAGGTDPKAKEAARQLEERRRNADTFGVIFQSFADDHLSTLRTGKEVEASIRKHVIPNWEHLPIAAIKRADVNELIRDIRKAAPIAANRVLAYLKKFFGWVVDQDIREDSPAASVKRPSKETKRDRVLTELEIRVIWEACEGLGAFGAACRLMLTTGQRRSEVGGMRWSEIDRSQKTWSLGRERTKADRAHDVPLSDLSMSIIQACPEVGPFVMSTGRSVGASKEATEISGWAKAKRRLDDAAVARLRYVTNDDGAVLADWHFHDLRRSCATYLAQDGVDRIVISKILNHAEGGVTGIYDRFRYEAQKRQALEAWANRITRIVEGLSGAVVSFPARALEHA